MNLLRTFGPALAALSLVLPAAAQRTVVVDAANGPGTNHTTLAAAFANLLANDRIVVRAGNYVGASVSTPHTFTLVGEGNPVFTPAVGSFGSTVAITMWGGAQQRVGILGITVQSQQTGQWALAVTTFQNNWPAPTVHLEDCVVDSTSPQADRVSLLAAAIGLTAQRCTLGTTQVVDSVATFVDCTITGDDLSFYQGFTQRAQTAMDVLRSTVWIVDSVVMAGNSNFVYAEPAACIGVTDSSTTTSSRVFVCGTSTLRCDQSPESQWPTPFVFQNYAPFYPVSPTVAYESSVTLLPTPSLGGIASAGVLLQQRSIPAAKASTAPLGGTFTATVQGNLNDIAVVYASTLSQPLPVLGVPVFLDLVTAVPLGFALVPANGSVGFPLPIANNLALRGFQLEASGATLSPAGVLELTNPIAGLLW